jgi:haloacetate dehalogenase
MYAALVAGDRAGGDSRGKQSAALLVVKAHAARVGGSGPPVLLLHGYPQTHAIWHRMAGPLAARFSVVAADLRGYGDSGKPPTAPDHEPYSKRAMARDLVEAMGLLGFDSFHVVGHDRGGRVGHRLAVDHAARSAR